PVGELATSDIEPTGLIANPVCAVAVTIPPTRAVFQITSRAAAPIGRFVIARASTRSTVLCIAYVRSHASVAVDQLLIPVMVMTPWACLRLRSSRGSARDRPD